MTKDLEQGESKQEYYLLAPILASLSSGLENMCVGRGQGGNKEWRGSQFLFYLLVEQDVVLRTHAKTLPDFIQTGFNVLSPNEHCP